MTEEQYNKCYEISRSKTFKQDEESKKLEMQLILLCDHTFPNGRAAIKDKLNGNWCFICARYI
jgi:hypothetical protein